MMKTLSLKERIGIATGIIAILGFLYTIGKFIDTRYAHYSDHKALAQDVKKIEKRLDFKIADDQLKAVQERIWIIKDRCERRGCTETEREDLRMLETQKESLQKKIDLMMREE